MKILIDTDLYIHFLRTGAFDENIRALYTFRASQIHFSAVVAEELLQGASKQLQRSLVEDLYKPFQKAGRLVTPTTQNWMDAGLVLSRLKEKGYSGLVSRLTLDALIAMSARSIGATVYTSNKKDFALIARVKSFHFETVPRLNS